MSLVSPLSPLLCLHISQFQRYAVSIFKSTCLGFILMELRPEFRVAVKGLDGGQSIRSVNSRTGS